MEVVVFIIAVAAAAIAGVAYWRSGGDADLRRAHREIRRELDTLRARQRELVDDAADALAAAYDRSRAELRRAQRRIAELGRTTIAGAESPLHRAGDHARSLISTVDHAAEKAAHLTVSGARTVEVGIARRARRIHARVVLLEVRASAVLAERAAGANDFDRADQRLTDAAQSLTEAQSMVADDPAIADRLADTKRMLHGAAEAVRTRAADARQRIDEVVADTDTVVGDLETLETRDQADDPDRPAPPTVHATR